jgi:PKD domain
MKGFSYLVVLIALALTAFALPASATDTATFQGNCTSSTLSCNFDAGRPSPGSHCSTGIAETAWMFGDTPIGWYYTSGTTISHTYAASGTYEVTVKVYCWDGQIPTATNYVCFSESFPGCIAAGGGWLP